MVIAITSNCFYELYNPLHPGPPDPITSMTVTVTHIVISNFVLTKSASYNWHQDSPQITIHKIAKSLTQSTTATSPFSYSYQCGSTIVSNYAQAYVFQFISNTFIIPFVLLTAMVTGESLCSRWPYASKVWMEICPLLLLRTASKIQNSHRSRGIICRVKTAGY